MKNFLRKHGRLMGGLYGLGTAVALFFGLKALGAALAACAIVLVVSAERLNP